MPSFSAQLDAMAKRTAEASRAAQAKADHARAQASAAAKEAAHSTASAMAAEAVAAATAAAAGGGAADDGVTQVGVQTGDGGQRFSVVEDLGPDAAAYFEPEALAKLQRPRAPDSGEQLARNLALREERLHGDKAGIYQSSGRLLFAEVAKKGRKPTSVGRVWVSERDRTVRDADDAEAAQATRRVLPRQAAPRIKRNA